MENPKRCAAENPFSALQGGPREDSRSSDLVGVWREGVRYELPGAGFFESDASSLRGATIFHGRGDVAYYE